MSAWAAGAIAFLVAGSTNALPAFNRRLRARLAHAPQDRWARVPTPAVGGVGIFLGVAAGLIAHGADTDAWQLFGAAAVAFTVGLIDDVAALPPRLKLAGQLAGALLVVAAGAVPDLGLPALLEQAAAVVWVVVLANAINLIDNMDALAAGTVVVAGIIVLGWSLRFDDIAPSLVVALIGAGAGFLIWNLHPARLFMGDAGSLFLGVLLGGITLDGAAAADGDLRLGLLVPIALLAYPLFDMTLVIVDRVRRGVPISRGGRDHSSHRLIRVGWSQPGAAAAWWVMSALSGTVAYLGRDLEAGPWAVLFAALITVYLVLGYALLRVPADG